MSIVFQKINFGFKLFLFFVLGIAALVLSSQNLMILNSYSLFAAFLYLLSHLVRALRFYFNISVGRDVSLRNSVAINFTSNAIGNVFFFVPLVKEILVLLTSLSFGIKSTGRIIFTIIYIRVFDLLFAIALFLAFYHVTDRTYSNAFYFIFFTVLLALLLLIFAHRLIDLFSDYCTKYHHNFFTLKMVEYLSSLKFFLKKKKFYKPENILLNTFFTVTSWGLEIIAVWALMRSSVSKSVDVILRNVTVYFDPTQSREIPRESLFLFACLVLISIFILIFQMRHEISRRK